MNSSEILKVRLQNQGLAGLEFKKPGELVKWMSMIQAQDFEGAKWGIAQRLYGYTNAKVQEAFDKGEILRTHVMRPTWHFVSPDDIKWMLALSAPAITALAKGQYRQLELDEKVFKKSNSVITKALEKNIALDRLELKEELKKNKLNTDDIRFSHMLMKAEIDALICSGPKKGKQFTYMLLDDRAPKAKLLSREESLAELCERYFKSHGPATVKDFAWWTGFNGGLAKTCIEMLGKKLRSFESGGLKYWIHTSSKNPEGKNDGIFLLPSYDEFTVGYADRNLFLDPGHSGITGHGIFRQVILKNGKICGLWSRTVSKSKTQVSTQAFKPFAIAAAKLLQREIKRYEYYLNG